MADKNKHINKEAFLKRLFNQSGYNKENEFTDPFEKEAAEGFEMFNSRTRANEFITNINEEIKKTTGLEKQSKPSIRSLLPYLSIAASIALIMGVFFIAKNVFEKPQQLAQNNDSAINSNVESSEEMYEWQSIEKNEVNNVIYNDTVFIESEEDTLPYNTELLAMNTIPQEKIENKNGQRLPEKSEGNSKKETVQPAKLKEESETTIDLLDAEDKEELDVKQRSNLSQNVEVNDATMPASTSANQTETVSKAFAESSNASSNNGLSLYSSGKYEEAIKALNNAPNTTENLYYLGMSYYNTNKFTKAISQFDEVINSGSTLANNAKWYKANALLFKGKEKEAVILLKQLSESNSSFNTVAKEKIEELE